MIDVIDCKIEIIEIEVEKGFAQSQQEPSEWEEL